MKNRAIDVIKQDSLNTVFIRGEIPYKAFFNICALFQHFRYWASQTFDLAYHRSASVLPFPSPGKSRTKCEAFQRQAMLLNLVAICFLILLLWSFSPCRSLEVWSRDWNRAVEPGGRGIAQMNLEVPSRHSIWSAPLQIS